MTSISKLKQSRTMDKINESIKGQSNPVEKEDEKNEWQPTADKAGNGTAVIRFLPAPAVDGDDALPWVRSFKHVFQGPGGWLYDECLTTLNDKCPVCEHNTALWNTGTQENQNTVRKQKRKLSYYANIYVVSDSAKPENEGKVFLYKFGKKIFDKITEAMNPEFEDEKPVNPFDFWEGANFKLKFRMVDGYRNYDKSEFSDPIPLLDGDDKKLEEIWNSEYSLKSIVDKSKFKSYDELKARLNKVIGISGAVNAPRSVEDVDVSSFTEDTTTKSFDSDADEDLDYFKSLAQSD